MPYVLTRANTIFQTIEAIGADRPNQIQALNRLRTGAPLWVAPRVTQPPVGSAAGAAQAQSDHVRDHWFGDPVVAGNPPVVTTAQNFTYPTTGWWEGWQGDAHEIVRQTFQRAFQVSLNITDAQYDALDPQTQPPADGQCWPISVIWMCGAPLFQGFVSWDRDTPSATGQPARPGGHVTVVLATPGVTTFHADNSDVTVRNGVLAPAFFNLGAQQNLAVIGHSNSTFMDLQRTQYEQTFDPMLGNYMPATIAPLPAMNAYVPQWFRLSTGPVITRMGA
jgi:hypothetical protein